MPALETAQVLVFVIKYQQQTYPSLKLDVASSNVKRESAWATTTHHILLFLQHFFRGACTSLQICLPLRESMWAILTANSLPATVSTLSVLSSAPCATIAEIKQGANSEAIESSYASFTTYPHTALPHPPQNLPVNCIPQLEQKDNKVGARAADWWLEEGASAGDCWSEGGDQIEGGIWSLVSDGVVVAGTFRVQKKAQAANTPRPAIAPTMMPATAPPDRPLFGSTLSTFCFCTVGASKTVASGKSSFLSSSLILRTPRSRG